MPDEQDKVQPPNNRTTALFARVVAILRGTDPDVKPEEFPHYLAQAGDELQAFIDQNPESVPALRLMAEVYHRQGQMTQTRDLIRRAESLDPWNLEILIISESLYGERAKSGERDHGQAPLLDSGLSSGAISTESLIEKAMGSYKLGQLERAYSLAKLAFRLEPAKGHHLLDVWSIGAALDPERTSRELIELMLEIPDQPFVYLAVGSIANVLGRLDDATGWLEKGITIETDDRYVSAMLHNELAYVLVRQNNRLDMATKHARKALDRFPDKQANGFIRDTLGLIYLKKGDLPKALRNFREAVAKDATTINRFHLAVALIHEGLLSEALAELRQISMSHPSMDSPHIEEAAILNRIQSQIGRLEDLLNLGGTDDIKDALSIMDGLA